MKIEQANYILRSKSLGDNLFVIEDSNYKSLVSGPLNIIQSRLLGDSYQDIGLQYLLNYQTIRFGTQLNIGIYSNNFFPLIHNSLWATEKTDNIVASFSKTDCNSPIVQILQKRRSVRKYRPNFFSIDNIANILINSQECRDVGGFKLRNTSSGGALFPISLYLVSQNIRGLERGLYRYQPLSQSLVLISNDYNSYVSKIFSNQSLIEIENASCILFMVFDYLQTYQKYGDLSLSLGMVEVGIIAQTIHLLSQSYGFGTCDIGGFDKVVADNFLLLDGINQHTVYAVTIGEQY